MSYKPNTYIDDVAFKQALSTYNEKVKDKYATITSNPNLTDEDLKNVARVSSAVYDVIDVSVHFLF